MSRKVKVDLTGVENFLRANEGEHLCRIAEADVKASQSGNDMIVVQFEVTKGDDKGARVFENYPLIDTALWKLKGLLQAIGMKADGKVQLDLDKLVGKVCIVAVKHEEYEGKTRARVDYVTKYSSASEDDEDEDADDVEDEEEEKEEKKPAKSSAKKASKSKPEPEEDDDDDWEDEDEEEEEKPKKSKKPEAKSSKKPEKKSKKSKDEDDDDWDDDDWDD